MEGHGIKATALTQDNIDQHPTLWREVENGELKIVYATSAVILRPRGYFLTNIVGRKNRFTSNIVAVAVDECHLKLIWDWVRFRTRYGEIGKVRSVLSDMPFICLSATL